MTSVQNLLQKTDDRVPWVPSVVVAFLVLRHRAFAEKLHSASCRVKAERDKAFLQVPSET